MIKFLNWILGGKKEKIASERLNRLRNRVIYAKCDYLLNHKIKG